MKIHTYLPNNMKCLFLFVINFFLLLNPLLPFKFYFSSSMHFFHSVRSCHQNSSREMELCSTLLLCRLTRSFIFSSDCLFVILMCEKLIGMLMGRNLPHSLTHRSAIRFDAKIFRARSNVTRYVSREWTWLRE